MLYPAGNHLMIGDGDGVYLTLLNFVSGLKLILWQQIPTANTKACLWMQS
jgi:hypothetical protein